MNLKAGRAMACAALAVFGTAGLTRADAATFTTNVTVTVELTSSSGICGVRTGKVAAGVTCGPLTQTVLGGTGAVSMQRIGMLPARGVVTEPLPLYGDATKFTSWRIVQLNNGDYVELTIVW
jgi:type IV secretory pathway protease TraF